MAEAEMTNLQKEIKHFDKIVMRSVAVDTSEARLMASVIMQAVHDSLIQNNSSTYNDFDDGKRFMSGKDGRLKVYCDAIGLEEDYIKEMFEVLKQRAKMYKELEDEKNNV